jgi:hypothetical protein
MEDEQPGQKPKFICLNCVPSEGVEVMPMNAEQVAQIQAAGFDWSADQINKLAQEQMSKHARRRR